MSPTLGLPCKGEAGLGRTALSAREVERAGVLRRVKEGKLKLSKRCTAAWDQYSPGQAALAAVSRARDRRAESTVLLAGSVIVPSRRDFANECCGWCGTSTAAGSTNGLVRRWPPNTWPAKMAWRSVPGHCDVGCCRRGYGVGSASADRIASGASARHISASWCSWMEVSCLARGSRSRRMFDESGGRRHRHHLVPLGEAGNDLGGGQPAPTLDRAIRHSSGSVHGLEECLCAASDRSGERGRAGATDAVWRHVRQAGHSHHRRQFATSQRPSGTQSWHASGSTDQEAAA